MTRWLQESQRVALGQSVISEDLVGGNLDHQGRREGEGLAGSRGRCGRRERVGWGGACVEVGRVAGGRGGMRGIFEYLRSIVTAVTNSKYTIPIMWDVEEFVYQGCTFNIFAHKLVAFEDFLHDVRWHLSLRHNPCGFAMQTSGLDQFVHVGAI